MAFAQGNALRRAQSLFAQLSHMLTQLRQPHSPRLPRVTSLDDRMLRDIGLHPADIEADRHQFPSQNQHHPRL